MRTAVALIKVQPQKGDRGREQYLKREEEFEAEEGDTLIGREHGGWLRMSVGCKDHDGAWNCNGFV
jgi:hypothetical protein